MPYLTPPNRTPTVTNARTLPQVAPFDMRQLATAQEAHSRDGHLALVAAELGCASEEEAISAAGAALGIKMIDLSGIEPDLSLLRSFPPKLIHRHNLFPIAEKDGSLIIATGNPFDLHAFDAIGAATGKSVEPVLVLPEEVNKLIKTHLGVGAETIDGLMGEGGSSSSIQVVEDLDFDQSDDSEAAQLAPVVRLVNEILEEAIEARTSDVHLEAQASGMKVRYRIDGVLQNQPIPPELNRFQSAIISRLKIMAKLNIAEKRIPQDGRIKVKVAGREVDIRVSIIPMLHGEGIVMRILDKDRMNFSLKGIGMDDSTYNRFNRLIEMPHGIVLVTGPTGSGKTTTLYSALNEIKDDSTKIITTEDPIEYQLEGINQIQVHNKVGLTFAASLRAILRHDPDVVLVGEIRDFETAENAVQAALTGHLVFSTLHTNDAAGAFMRMIDMGVEPFLVSSTVEGVMAQRLIRTLCPECREPYEPEPVDIPADFPYQDLIDQQEKIYRPVGCRECRGTGYSGRRGIYELLETNDTIRDLAGEKINSIEIKRAAVKNGMRTLREDGWRKVLWGYTSIEEILRVTKID
jgi:general secretion pathway protein E